MHLTDWMWLLLPGVGTILLAVLSGAGGSALLELYYKPRRDKKRLGAVLYAEILQNAQYILLWSHARKSQPMSVPADFHLSTVGFEATADLFRELRPDLLKKVLLLYGHFTAANQNVALFAEAFDQFESQRRAGEGTSKARRHMDTVIDTFNHGLDTAFDRSKEVLPFIMKLGGIKEKVDPNELPPDYEDRVRRHFTERAIRLKGLEATDSE